MTRFPSHNRPGQSGDVRGDPERFSDTKDAPAEEEHYIKDPVQLPQSTHSLLFTQPVCSLPFAFAVGILLTSFGCLGLAFINNVDVNEIPVNVTPAVRGAQYLSILVVLLMEEGEHYSCITFLFSYAVAS